MNRFKENIWVGKPTKAQIKMLIRYGIIERFGGSFGYCNLTDKAEKHIYTSRYSTNIFIFRGGFYSIQYVSGCFYPMVNCYSVNSLYDTSEFKDITNIFKDKVITDKDTLNELYDCI